MPDVPEPSVEQLAAVTRQFNALPVPFVDSVHVSPATLFLFSDDARYITGSQFPVDAGCSLL